MLRKTTRTVLLGSVAAFAFGAAYAQTDDTAEGDVDPEACVILAERLSDTDEVDGDTRTEVEQVIASGEPEQCDMVLTTWEDEGTLSRESVDRVATERASERLIVQQEVEVDAEVAVYQPPAEVDVDTGTPEIQWTLPRQNVTVDEPAPQITIRQGRPTVQVEVPQPRVRVMIPEPEVIITWPEATLDMADLEPQIEVRIPEPVVSVTMPEPVIELSIAGSGPSELVELEDGRYAPEGATAEDLEPRVSVQQGEPTVERTGEAEAPEIQFNRGEPEVSFEGEDAEVTVEIVGEPEIEISTGQRNGEGDATVREDTAEDDAADQDDAIEQDETLDDPEAPVDEDQDNLEADD